jgi:hypothetical protein
MLKDIVDEVKLIKVGGYPKAIPIVAGFRLDAGHVGAGGVPPEYANAAKIVEIMVRCFANGARTEELNKQFQEETGLKPQTFYKARSAALAKPWIVGEGSTVQGGGKRLPDQAADWISPINAARTPMGVNCITAWRSRHFPICFPGASRAILGKRGGWLRRFKEVNQEISETVASLTC